MSSILILLRQFWPFLVAFGIGLSSGFGCAWKIQGYRLTEAKQEFAGYKQAQAQAVIEAREAADKQREESAKQYAHLSEILSDEINSGVVYKRCVDAGRCGVRKQSCPVQVGTVPPTVRTDETGADSIPIGQEPTKELAAECAETVLLLNQLQSAIEGQEGY